MLLASLVAHVLLISAIVHIFIKTVSSTEPNRLALCFLFLLLGLTAYLIFQTPYSASNLSIVPDSVEYAVAAERTLVFGNYNLLIGETLHPSRYPPGFSLIGILPYLYLFGDELGNGIWFVFLSSLVLVAAAFFVGFRVGGLHAGILGATVPLLSRLIYQGNVITPHLSCAALTLVALLAFQELRRHPREILLWGNTGIVIAVATSFRPLSLFLLLPFLTVACKERIYRGLCIMLAPIIGSCGLGIWYNFMTFGDILRTGYHYWCPMPYDFFPLTFNLSYFGQNLSALVATSVSVGIFALLAAFYFELSSKDKINNVRLITQEFLEAGFFTLLAIAPLVFLHLFYFFSNSIFFLPADVAVSVLLGILLARLCVKLKVSPVFRITLTLLLLMVVTYIGTALKPGLPLRRIAVSSLNESLPHDALLISSFDPVYLEPLFTRGTSRSVIPTSRNVEFASKLIAPHKVVVPDLKSAYWGDHRSLEIAKNGGKDAIEEVATEHTKVVQGALSRGRSVFFHFASATEQERRDMSLLYVLSETKSEEYQEVLSVK